MRKITLLFTTGLLFCLMGQAHAQNLASLLKNATENKKDSKEEKQESKKGYSELITSKARTSKGVITLHRIDSKLYFEIPFDLMGKDMLFSGRVSQTSNNKDIIAGQMPQDPLQVSWSADEEKVYLHKVVSDGICDENESIYIGFQRNNIRPIMKAFPIKAVNPDSTGVVIDVTAYFCSDEAPMSPFAPASILDAFLGNQKMSGSLKSDMSSIIDCKAFPRNINITSRLSFAVSKEPFTAVVTASMILLPEEIMQPRFSDYRIGYFQERKVKYTEHKDQAESLSYINRWKLAPRPEDVEKHRRGEVVEPAKPIVYYIDNAFPEKWRPYLKKGIEDWQYAFEQIGFKNAIIAKDYPADDPDFSPADIRNSCLIYAPTQIENAMGPSWVDPRSGEILQGSVYFYHNVIKLVHNWKFIQTATVDPKARQETFDTETMGALLRYIVAHEIGHTLGLMHNMRASYAYPVDSLRSPSFTNQYGTTPSIMDYARYNYVAQPGDGVTQLLPPRLGVYDIFAIKWGYAPIYEANSPEEEKPILNQWLKEKSDDPMYRYGEQEFFDLNDPASQSEALGDDAVKASEYGFQNLRLLMKNLVAWTAKEGENYQYTKNMYREVFRQINRYIGHCEAYLGGNFKNYPVAGDRHTTAFDAVPKAKQQEALRFIMRQIRELPEWMLDKDILRLFDPANDLIGDYQALTLRGLINGSTLGKIGFTAKWSTDPYTPEEYLDDLYQEVWGKTERGESLSRTDKVLEYVYVHYLFDALDLLKPVAEKPKKISDELKEILLDRESMPYMYPALWGELLEEHQLSTNTKESDLKIVARPLYYEQLQRVKAVVEKRAKSSKGDLKKHYQYLSYEIANTLK